MNNYKQFAKKYPQNITKLGSQNIKKTISKDGKKVTFEMNIKGTELKK